MKTYALSILLWVACSVTAAAAPTLSLAPDRTWIPTKDNTCDITVNLTGAPANSTVTFQLIATNWPGYCMNAYDRGTPENRITAPDKSPDLRFVAAAQHSHAEEPTSVALTWQLVAGGTEGPAIEVSWGNTAPTSLKVKIRCYDYGAIGKVNAGLYNGADASGTKQYVLAETMIPYSTNSNYIADEQEKQAGWVGWSGTNEKDSEKGPTGNTHPGDGLTAFEEYRGFEVKGVHTRTSPLKKDAFVHTELPEYGIGWASKLPDIFALHLIDETEHSQGNSRQINHLVCLPFYLLGQKAIWVRKFEEKSNKWGTRPGALGVARGVAPTQGPVRMVEARIYVNIIRNALTNHEDKDYDTQVNKTIGHEIAHHFNLPEVVPRVGIGNFRFVWENDPLPDVDFSDLTSPQSVMRQGLYRSDSDTFPTYHNPQYYVKPDTLKSGERPTGGASRLPDFDAAFDAANTRSPTNSPNGEGDDDAAPGAPQAPSRPGCGGGAYCNDTGQCSSLGNASQSTCGKASCFCSGHAAPAAPSASCSSTGAPPTTGRWAGLHSCNDRGTCVRTGYSNVSSCARSGCACRPTPIPTTGCGGGAYCNDRGSCSSTGNASQSTCGKASCFCSGHAAPAAPSASCSSTGAPPTTGRWAGLHSCNDRGTCVRTGYSNVSSCARSGCACRPPTSDTNSSGNNTSTPPTPPTPPSSSGNNTSTPVTLPCGHLPTVSGTHSYVTRCPATNGRGARCTNASGYYACTPHQHSYPSAPVTPMHPCGIHQRTVSGNHAWVSSCTVPNSRGQSCTNASGYYACTPHEHSYPSAPVRVAPPCGVHPVGAAGNHARVSSCAVPNSRGQTCTNTTGYYACTPHEHTYPTPAPSPPMHPCGTHQRTVSGNHAWVSSCTVPNSRGQTCTNASGYYACTPHTHAYPPVVRYEACNVHTSGTNGSHAWVSSCAVPNRYGQSCTNTSGYYACSPHTHAYPPVVRYEACNVHTSGTNGSHAWVSSCAVPNRYGQSCTNTSGYYACSPHTHAYPPVVRYEACNVHTSGTNGSHAWVSSCAVTNSRGQTCTNASGYYACTPHTHAYPPVVRYEACNVHTSGTNGSHAWVSSCAVTNSQNQTCTNASGYYACSPHTHTYPRRMHRCGEHPLSSGGNHSYIRCPSRQNGYQCTGYRYACRSHNHTYPRVRPCRHLQSASGRHHWVSSCTVSDGYGQSCTNASGYYACTPHTHTYPRRMHRCGEHPLSSGGNHSYIRCPSRQNGYQCTGYRYACRSHTHTYPRLRPCQHSYSSGGNHSYIRCPSRQNGYQCTGYRYACRSHTHTYPAVRPCGHSYSSGGNHTRVTCPRNAAGDACSSGNYYVCRSHTHRYPARRPCGHSYSSGGNHTRVTCPRNAAGDACSSGNYYVCRSHTHRYPARRPCGHLQSASGNHSYGRCTTRQNGAQCSGSRYACKSHTHTYRRPCGHLQSASGNHSYGRCTTRQNGAQCSGSRYACKSHTHTYRRPCGHLQSASGNHSYGRCTTRQNGAQCSGSRYACKSHTHTYRRPCGHLQSASGSHSYGRCTTTRNGQRCSGSRYACKSHTHTYPTSSGNNSSGNNSSGNNSSSNNSSGNNSSGNNSSGNNSSGVRCGNTGRGASACSSGGYASSRDAHRARCRRGHTYWGCNPNAVRWHSRH